MAPKSKRRREWEDSDSESESSLSDSDFGTKKTAKGKGKKGAGKGKGKGRGKKHDEPTPAISSSSSTSSEEFSDDSASEFDDGYGSDLMGDAGDRARLAALPEIERESILLDRAEKRQEAKERWELAQKVKEATRKGKAKRRRTTAAAARGNKAGMSAKDRRAAQLAEMRQRREDKSGRATDWKPSPSPVGDEEEDDNRDGDYDDRDNDFDVAAAKPGKGVVGRGRGRRAQQEEEEQEDLELPIDEEDLKKMIVSRYRLERWLGNPLFEENVPDFYVRAHLGRSAKRDTDIYRILRIVDVEKKPDRVYELKQSNKKTDLYLRVRPPNSTTSRTLSIAVVSNQPFTDEDWRFFKHDSKAENSWPSKRDRKRCDERREKLDSFRYTNEQIEEILKEKRTKGQLKINVTTQLEELRREAEIADRSGQYQLRDDLEKEIDRLVLEHKNARTRQDSRVNTVAAINRKNEQLNAQVLREVGDSATHKMDNDVVEDDPFMRRPTRPVVLFDVGQKSKQDRKKARAEAAARAAAAKEKEAEEKKKRALRIDTKKGNARGGNGVLSPISPRVSDLDHAPERETPSEMLRRVHNMTLDIDLSAMAAAQSRKRIPLPAMTSDLFPKLQPKQVISGNKERKEVERTLTIPEYTQQALAQQSDDEA